LAKLTVITGCMFSGKSTELIRLLIREQYARKSVVLIRPPTDTRTSAEMVITRLGVSFPSRISYRAFLDGPAYDVVGIDEAQFFDSNIIHDVEVLLAFSHDVIVAGLNQDFANRPFGEMSTLLAMADRIITVTAVCTVCGEEATKTQRLIDGQPASASDPVVLVGGMGDETYEARCRNHHEVRF